MLEKFLKEELADKYVLRFSYRLYRHRNARWVFEAEPGHIHERNHEFGPGKS